MAFDGNFLASLTDAERALLAEDAERIPVRPGYTIVWRGEILNRICFLESGRAEAKYRLRRCEAAVALVPGDFFGERALDDDPTSDSCVRASEEGCVAAVPAASLRRLLSGSQTAARSFWERVDSRRIALWSASGVLQQLPTFN